MQNIARKGILLPAAFAAAMASLALTAGPASADASRVVVSSNLYPARTASVDIESSNPNGSPSLSNCVRVSAGQNASLNVFVENGAGVNINFYRNSDCSSTISSTNRRAPNPVSNVWNING
ncbi:MULTISPECIES: hypothetical protein [unclassified Streptomyces]|uniref:hypothetical protein n=1 Tax=unclassified Streptomyces TaxID=2593676 RepID=UPI003816DA06